VEPNPKLPVSLGGGQPAPEIEETQIQPEQPQSRPRLATLVSDEMIRQQKEREIDSALSVDSDAPLSKRIAARLVRKNEGLE